MSNNKLVYIASPYAGDVEQNVRFAKAACRYAIEQGATPIAVHLLYPQLFDSSSIPPIILSKLQGKGLPL